MSSLSAQLKQLIVTRLETASASEIVEIVGQLCEAEQPLPFKFDPTPTTRFIARDGMVEDAATGLIWSADDVGERASWADAKKAAAALTLGGFTDWRLPTIKELLTLVDYGRSSPPIDTAAFPTCKSDWYWTATPLASSPGDYAWGVAFDDGGAHCNFQGNEGLVRAVRPRQ